jgi:two-component system NtrC family response regulator
VTGSDNNFALKEIQNLGPHGKAMSQPHAHNERDADPPAFPEDNTYQLVKEATDVARNSPPEYAEEIIATSECMQRVLEAIPKLANADVPILIRGESGTGKELMARAIHARSHRCDAPFVAINCAAIPDALIESELFGHEKGSFTGATQQMKGRTESANEGTLFLDEIGELPLGLQVKLLRFLHSGAIERVGGRKEIQLNVRVIAATNRDVQAAIHAGAFRQDLYYRLAVVDFCVPSLRERGEDILLLACYFLRRFNNTNNKGIKGFTKEALQALESYTWPGNVRELSNKVRRAVAMAEGAYLSAADLDLPITNTKTVKPPLSLDEAIRQLRTHMIVEAVALYEGNLSQAAKNLGLSRPTLYRFLRKLGMR